MKLAIVVAISMALSGRARADDSKAAAREHVAAARTLHADHRYAEALTELEAAYALDPTPALLFALGQVHVQLGRCERAVGFYRRFLATRPKPDHAGVAREAIDACSHPSTSNLRTDASLSTHTDVSIKPSSVVLPPAPPPVARTRKPLAAIGLAVIGTGAAIGSLALYRGALVDRDRADAAATYDEFEHFTDRARGRQTGAIVSGVVGVAGLTAGAILFAMRRHDTVRVTARGDGGAVSWSTRF